MGRPGILRSLSWAPTISLSWMWGLGFFYAMHVVWTQGWLGFWVFAIANAVGLATFGCVLGARNRDPEALFATIGKRFVPLFLLCQVGAIAITLFSLSTYLWPLLLVDADPGIALALTVLVVAVACAIAHAVPLETLRLWHCGALAIAALAIAAAWMAMPAEDATVRGHEIAATQSLTALIAPTLVGFALGPWSDIQQWQRVIEIRRNGASPTIAYLGGGLIFLALLTANAGLSSAAGVHLMVAADGTLLAQGSVAARFGAQSLGLGAFAFALWAVIAAISTIDSFYCAVRWYLGALVEKSLHPALAFVPAAAVASPLWLLCLGALGAGVMGTLALSQTAYMMPYATLLVAPTLGVVVWSLARPVPFDTLFAYWWGIVAALTFFLGFGSDLPALVLASPVLAFIGAGPLLRSAFAGKVVALSGHEASGAALAVSKNAATTLPARVQPPAPPSGPIAAGSLVRLAALAASNDTTPTHGFEGQTFVMRITPTYDDTNSVGNVYFANYIRWVGKARELFFNACMPKFDLETTRYLVLTKSIQHDFRREIAEFDPATVRIRIERHNRKFVTLAHEIRDSENELIGRGEQDLMFVDRESFKPLNIPADIVRGFLPYWPTQRPDAGGERPRKPATSLTGQDGRTNRSGIA